MKYVPACALMLLVLTACGGGKSPHAANSSVTSSPPVSSPTASATHASAAAGNPVDSAAFCAFLAKMAPRLKSDGSSAGAEADFAIEFASWIEDQPQKPRTASDLDDASQQTCPQARTDVVAAMGANSFSDALG